MNATQTTPASLEALLEAVKAGAFSDREMTKLPTFGGETPINTTNIWSWDATRLLIGLGSDDFRIIDRMDDFEDVSWRLEDVESAIEKAKLTTTAHRGPALARAIEAARALLSELEKVQS